jgi:hypothetical protein
MINRCVIIFWTHKLLPPLPGIGKLTVYTRINLTLLMLSTMRNVEPYAQQRITLPLVDAGCIRAVP